MKFSCALAGLAGLLLLGSCSKDKEEPRQTYQLNEANSLATWQGFLRTGYFNEGTIEVHSEQLEARGGKITSGTFVMPLLSLKNSNLPVEQKEVLVHHLQSTDFFNMALHPNLRFDITQVAPYTGGSAGAIDGANYLVTGGLTLLGQTHPITFPAKIDLTDNTIAVRADLSVDRTQWGITYAANPTLPAEQNILPAIKLHLDVQGTRK